MFVELAFACYLAVPGCKIFFLEDILQSSWHLSCVCIAKTEALSRTTEGLTCTVYRNKGLVTRTLTLFPRPPVVCLPVNENQAYVQYFQPVCSRAAPSLPRFCLRGRGGGVHRLNNFNDSITEINRGIIPSIFQIWSALACCEKLAWELKGKQKQVNIWVNNR